MRIKAAQVIAAMRDRMLRGEWPPGARIPIKTELRQAFNASDGTIQKALDALSAEGFLKSRGWRGTFVRDQTPDRCRVALALGEAEGTSAWQDGAARIAAALNKDAQAWIDTYFACSLDEEGHPGEGLVRLREDIAQRRLAGVIFYGIRLQLFKDPALDRPGLARVKVPGVVGDVPFPTVARHDYVPLALRFLRARGRRRLAILTTFAWMDSRIEPLLTAAGRLGLETRRAWVQVVDPKTKHSARPIVELMMTLPRSRRPDALLVLDDHLVTEAANGVADAGVKSPHDIDVVSVANFPSTMPVAVPVTFVGHDLEAELRLALQLINLQLAGNASPGDRWLNPMLKPAKGVDGAMMLERDESGMASGAKTGRKTLTAILEDSQRTEQLGDAPSHEGAGE